MKRILICLALVMGMVAGEVSAGASQPWPTKPASVPDPYEYERYLFSATNPSDFSQSNIAQTGRRTSTAALRNSPQELHGVIGPDVSGAWRITTGRPDVVLAIVDDGITWRKTRAEFVDLLPKFYLNAGEAKEPRPGVPAPYPAHPFDKNGDGVFNLRDYCSGLGPGPVCEDPAVSDRNGNNLIDPEDLILNPVFSDGVDDDANGYTDDISGWDSFQNDNNPLDDVGYEHGFWRATESAAQAGNGNGVGVCPSCVVMPVRVGDSFVVESNAFAKGVAFAVDAGASEIQASLGTLNTTSLAQQAVNYAYASGVPVVAASANEEAGHHNMPAGLEHTIMMNALMSKDAWANEGYLYTFNCSNHGAKLLASTPSPSCSSGATANTGGMIGLTISVAKNRIAQGRLTSYPRDDGTLAPYPLSANEVAQLLRASADDIDFSTPRGGDPPNNYDMPAVYGALENKRWQTVGGWDQYTGYGRLNARRLVTLVSDSITAAPKIPPEADITSPAWFDILPGSGMVPVSGRVAANRASSFDWVVEWAPGVQPPQWPATDTWTQFGGGSSTSAVSGVLGTLDMSQVAAAMAGTTGPPVTAGQQPDPEKFAVRLRLRALDNFGNLGEFQKVVSVHDDPDLLPGFPYRLGAAGEPSPAYADLDGDGRDELVLGDSDGRVHAFRSDMSELAGWPVSVDPLPVDAGAAAFSSGALDAAARPSISNGAPVVVDLESDGVLEVVVADYEGKVYVFEPDGSRRAGFPVSVDRTYSAPAVRDAANRVHWSISGAPVAGDLDADGTKEIIAGAYDRHVYAWHADGSAVNGWPVLIRDPAKVQSVDPVNHKLTFVAGSGREIGSKIIVSPALGDLDADGRPEVIVAANESYQEPVNAPASYDLSAMIGMPAGNTRLYAVRPDGLAAPGVPPGSSLDPAEFLPGWPVKLPMFTVGLIPLIGTGTNGQPVLADIDGDGIPEVSAQSSTGIAMVFRSDGVGFYGRDADGKDLPVAGGPNGPGSLSTESGILAIVGGQAYSRLSGGPTPHLLAGGSGPLQTFDLFTLGNLTQGNHLAGAWDLTQPGLDGSSGGQFLPGFPHPMNDTQLFVQPMAADLDGDGNPDMVIGSSRYDLRAMNGSGTPVPGWPRFTGAWNTATPAVGDWRGDGSQVIAHVTRRGLLFAWPVGGSVCSSDWPRFGHDGANSGNYTSDATAPAAVTEVAAVGSDAGPRLRWLKAGDDAKCGRAARYEIRYGPAPVDASNWAGATVLTESASGPADELEIGAAPGLAGQWAAIRAFDEQGNGSPLSPSVRLRDGLPERTGVDSSGDEAAGPSRRPVVSDDGRYVAFHSPSADLVAGDTNGAGDVFVRDRAADTTERISLAAGGTEANGGSRFPAITPDGRFVAFMSDASNLVAGDTNGKEDIFVWDRNTGVIDRVSVSSTGTGGAGGDSRFPAISPDGRFVVFQSAAAGLVPGDTNGAWDVFVRDRIPGTTERVSTAPGGVQLRIGSARPAISDDGRYVAYHTWATGFGAPDSNGASDVIRYDRQAGTASVVSVTGGGSTGNGESGFPKLSGDGAVVAFHSSASDLVAGDGNGRRDTFSRDTGAGSTDLISVPAAGGEADGPSGYAAISSDARYVAFHSTATNLVAGDGNAAQDVFMRDRVATTTVRLSCTVYGAEAGGLSGSAALSAGAGYVAFHSYAPDLIVGDTNAGQDAFIGRGAGVPPLC